MDSSDQTHWQDIGREIILWARTLASAGVYAALIVTFGFQIARVEGRSMQPTLEDQDRLVVNKLEYRIGNPQVGDVVMVLHPNKPEMTLVKRVVAGPGDTVALRDGNVLRNGVLLGETFVSKEFRSHEDREAEIVPEGYYFVLGDHRNNSNDSRSFGSVPRKYILGKVQLRWWPMNRPIVQQP